MPVLGNQVFVRVISFILFFRNFTGDPFHGASQEAFPKDISKILMAPINHDDIEIKPDGMQI